MDRDADEGPGQKCSAALHHREHKEALEEFQKQVKAGGGKKGH